MLEEKVKQIIKTHNLIEKNETVIACVSGGPDSMCLLNIMYELKDELGFNLAVCHVNHMLRKNAVLDEEYVANYCENKNIPIYILHADIENIAKEEKLGLEEAGRNARYVFFEETAKKIGATKIATAHNANDNAETVIMNILRGTSINGLKGIEEKREKIIRPLLTITRKEIEQYCTDRNLNPRLDESNKNIIYTRNKIRNELIPYIEKEFNPNIIEGINRMSYLAAEETDYLQTQAKKAYNDICIEETKQKIILDLKKFNLLALVIKRRVILYTIWKILGTNNRNTKNTYRRYYQVM